MPLHGGYLSIPAQRIFAGFRRCVDLNLELCPRARDDKPLVSAAATAFCLPLITLTSAYETLRRMYSVLPVTVSRARQSSMPGAGIIRKSRRVILGLTDRSEFSYPSRGSLPAFVDRSVGLVELELPRGVRVPAEYRYLGS